MKSITFLAVLGLLLQQPNPTPTPLPTVEGVVLEATTGKPLDRVRVTLQDAAPEFVFRSPQTFGEGMTDAQGRFTVQGKPGRYRVVPDLQGFVHSRPERFQAPREPGVWVQLDAAERVQNVELRMVREAVISGRAFDADGQPLAGKTNTAALYRYKYDDYGNRQLSGIRSVSYPGSAWSFVRMDDRGEFRFYGLQPGDYYVSISGGGAVGAASTTYYPGTLDEAMAAPIRLEAGEERQLGSIVLRRRQTKAAQVRFHFPDDGSVPGMRDVRFRGGTMVPVPGSERGRIVLPAVAPGNYDVLVGAGLLVGTGTPALYSRFSLEVGDSDVDRDIVFSPAFRAKVYLMMDDAAGRRTNIFLSNNCRLRSDITNALCSNAMVPGFYQLELRDLPPDAYVVSAKTDGRDLIREGVQLEAETEIEVLLATPGGIIEGSVTDANSARMTDAVVALVPDAPLRSIGLYYRVTTSDPKGNFELRGIAPGSYRLFAWTELEGAAYRNAEFIKKFEERGIPVRFDKVSRLTTNLTVLDESENGQK